MVGRNGFLIPYAFSVNGDLVSRGDAVKGNDYFCLGCGQRLVVRLGNVKTKHFAHLGRFVCSSETVIHATAKRLIVEVIALWKVGGVRPQVLRRCGSCGGKGLQYLPDRVLSAGVEYCLESGYVVDVAMFGSDGVIAAVEVYVTHLVTKEKSEGLGIPWVELIGSEVVEEPLLWKPMVDNFKSYKCKNCNLLEIGKKRALERISLRLGIKLPWADYVAAPYKCYRCEREILIFSWPGRTMWSVEKPPLPIPPSVKFSYTKTAGSWYWANTCLYCKAVQGDFFTQLG